jgi:hypothetical protein
LLTYHPGSGTTTYTLTLGRAAAQVGATASFAPGVLGPPATATAPPPSTTPGSSSPGGGSFSLPPDGQTTVGTGSGNEPPSVAGPTTNTANNLLAGGPTGWMVFGVIAAMLICAVALPRIAGRFLSAPAGADCEENE